MDVTVVDILNEERSGDLATLYGDDEGWSYRSSEAIRRVARNTDLVLGLVDRDGTLVAGLVDDNEGVGFERLESLPGPDGDKYCSLVRQQDG